MTEMTPPRLTVRRLLVDLEAPFAPNWSGDVFTTAFFNAMSMSFPAGEQFFIDAVRRTAATLATDAGSGLSEARRLAIDAEVKGFVGQEATHRRIHTLFNAHLTHHGLRNHWEGRIVARRAFLDSKDPRHSLAITVANEHFTALLAEHLLTYPEILAHADPRMQTLWAWHAAEESEHRSVAFDVYVAAGGSLKWRRRWMVSAALFLITDTLRQTVHNLYTQGQLWKMDTWSGAARFFFGKTGVVPHTFKPWLAFFSADFHPSQHADTRAQTWLAQHAHSYKAANGQ